MGRASSLEHAKTNRALRFGRLDDLWPLTLSTWLCGAGALVGHRGLIRTAHADKVSAARNRLHARAHRPVRSRAERLRGGGRRASRARARSGSDAASSIVHMQCLHASSRWFSSPSGSLARPCTLDNVSARSEQRRIPAVSRVMRHGDHTRHRAGHGAVVAVHEALCRLMRATIT